MHSDKDRVKIIELAGKHVKKGKLQEAIAEYKKLLTGEAQDISVRNIISDLWLRANKKGRAIEEFYEIATYYEERGLYSQSMAIYKKINKLDPGNIESATKLADLLGSQGFLSEAKTEYLEIAKNLRKNNRTKEAISLYEKLIKLDKKDIQPRLTLAELYTNAGLVDKAIKELNEAAEFKIRTNALKEARGILVQARKLKWDHSRTLTNLIDLLKRENRKKDALNLINDILKKDKDNVKALMLLGSLYFDDQNLKKAEEIFSKILSLRPKDVEARVKLGRTNIHQGNLDQAFELYGPLVDTLIRKQRAEKAIGLLGLILSSKKAHIPTLKKLASIYKSKNQKKNLEIAYRIILEEYRLRNLREESLPVLNELVSLCPENEEFKNEYNLLRKAFGPLEEKKEEEKVLEEEKAAQEPLREEIKAEKVIEVEKAVEETIEAEKAAQEPLREEIKAEKVIEVEKAVEETIEAEKEVEEPLKEAIKAEEVIKEEKVIEETIEAEKEVEEPLKEKIKAEEPVEEEKEAEEPVELVEGTKEMLETNLAQADLYLEQGLLRNARRILENLRINYPKEPRIEQKIAAISEITFQVNEEEILQRVEKVSRKESQLFEKKASSQEEENLTSDVVSEFRRVVEENVDKEDYESRFNLGVSFLEQGLIEEAIEEFKLASKDKSLSVECYSVIGNCYREKKDFLEAAKWVEKALGLTDKGSGKFFSLKYEVASLYEELKKTEKALALYNEIKEWNSGYRDVDKKINFLRKSLNK